MESYDDLEDREEAAAAAEAASIGGETPDAALDPADRPLAEAGQGEAEGFEIAESDLVRNASHDDGRAQPIGDRFAGETESDLSGAEYGEGDEPEPSDS